MNNPEHNHLCTNVNSNRNVFIIQLKKHKKSAPNFFLFINLVICIKENRSVNNTNQAKSRLQIKV